LAEGHLLRKLAVKLKKTKPAAGDIAAGLTDLFNDPSGRFLPETPETSDP
jgi:hypothetical protein